MCISTSCLFGRARRKVCFQPDVEHFPPQICLFFFSCRSDCVTGVPVCHAGFLCDFFFFFFNPSGVEFGVIKATGMEGTSSRVSKHWGQRLSHSSERHLHCSIPAVWGTLFLQMLFPSPGSRSPCWNLTEWQPKRQKNCTKVLRYFKCFYTAWQQLPLVREEFSRAAGKRAQ